MTKLLVGLAACVVSSMFIFTVVTILARCESYATLNNTQHQWVQGQCYIKHDDRWLTRREYGFAVHGIKEN